MRRQEVIRPPETRCAFIHIICITLAAIFLFLPTSSSLLGQPENSYFRPSEESIDNKYQKEIEELKTVIKKQKNQTSLLEKKLKIE